MSLFMRKGKSKFYFVPSIAAPATPTQAELTAGTQLTSALAGFTGFDAKAQFIDAPNFGAVQTPKIPGEIQSSDSSLEFNEDDTSNPLRTTLARGTVGYILVSPNGATISTSKVDVFPIQVAANTRNYASGNAVAKYTVDVAITSIPSSDAVMGA